MKTLRPYLFILPALFTCMQAFSQARSDYGAYKDWSITETRVIGMIRLTDTLMREVDRIIRVDSNTVRIEEYNPAGVLTSSTMVHFLNQHISAIEYINQWGLRYEKLSFTPDTAQAHTYRVTDLRYGENNYLPCKEAKRIYKNDLLTELQCISFSGKLRNDFYGVAVVKYKYFEDPLRYGLQKELSYFDEDGSPVISRYFDYHRIVYDRDKRGNVISKEFYNEEDHRMLNSVGYSQLKSTYDALDNVAEDFYFGTKGEVKKTVYGVARGVLEYENGLETSLTLYDDQNCIIKSSDTGSGVAVIRREYNPDGFVTSKSYFDEAKDPMNGEGGIHKIIYRYNPRDMLIAEEYYDKTGAPAVNKHKIHRYMYGRDDRGRQISISYFGINGRPVKNDMEEIYMKKYQYNDNLQTESESYWQDANTKMHSWSGVHKRVFLYNDQGQETEENNYDKYGTPVVSKSGYSRLVTKYDANARISEYSRFKGSTPAVVVHSTIREYHSIRFTYDDKNKVSLIEYLDTSENPTNAQIDLGDTVLCYKIELSYVDSRLTEERFYLKGMSFPIKTIDCLKSDYVDPNGIIIDPKVR